MENKNLEKLAKEIRIDILEMAYNAQSAHTGGSLSCVEILTTLYFSVMKVFPKNPNNPNRDRLIFSKAHDAKAIYAVLGKAGFFKKEKFLEYEKSGGSLPGHSGRSVPGIEYSGGSLGHGLSIAAGMAYAGKLDKKNYKIYAVISDGECDEGSTWEAALFAGHHKLKNLIAVIDYNKLQAYGFTKDVLDLEPLAKKFESFNWKVVEVNGHSFEDLKKALKTVHAKPLVIIAHTIKGFGGIPKYVNTVASQYRPPTKEETDKAVELLK